MLPTFRSRPVLLTAFVVSLLGCAVGPPAAGTSATADPAGDDSGDPGVWPADDGGNDDSSSALPASNQGADANVEPPGDDAAPDDSSSPLDAAQSAAPPPGACASPLAPGDLVIDELMIESVAGTGDYGEWLEVRSTLPCSADLRGLHGECPSGAKVRTFDVTDHLWVPAGGTFVVADSYDPAINHDLPGDVIAWSSQPGDVLRNKGATISLLVQDQLIDSVTYPALKLTVGTSLEFPPDCPLDRRSDWTAWEASSTSWFPGFFGTPNAPNADVSCP
jgi:hypothetical protein